MQLKNNYMYFTSEIEKKTCMQIISYGNQKIEYEKQQGKDTYGTTFGSKEKQKNKNLIPQYDNSLQQLTKKGLTENDIYVRDSEITWLDDKWIYDLLIPNILEANKAANWNFEIDYFEKIQFTVYYPGGFYGWHTDGGSDHNAKYKRYIYGISEKPLNEKGEIPVGYVRDENMVGKVRKISLTLNLSEPTSYEGGNLLFDFSEHSHKERFHECLNARNQGSLIIFPSFIPHCVTPVTSGKRYSLVLWSLGEPFK